VHRRRGADGGLHLPQRERGRRHRPLRLHAVSQEHFRGDRLPQRRRPVCGVPGRRDPLGRRLLEVGARPTWVVDSVDSGPSALAPC
jgi:hypothetical protein